MPVGGEIRGSGMNSPKSGSKKENAEIVGGTMNE